MGTTSLAPSGGKADSPLSGVTQSLALRARILYYKVSGRLSRFTPDTSYETSEEWIRFYFFDRIYRIDGIFFAFGEEPFRPKAVLSR